jgi:hypothetical protein
MDAFFTPRRDPTGDPRCVLEQRFPHILQAVAAKWHSQAQAEECLNRFLVGDRDARQGLPAEAFEELMFLSELNWQRAHFNAEGVLLSADGFSFRSF